MFGAAPHRRAGAVRGPVSGLGSGRQAGSGYHSAGRSRVSPVDLRGDRMKTAMLMLMMVEGMLAAQGQLSLAGPGAARPGETITVSINSSIDQPAGLQWKFNAPASFLFVP